MPMRPAAGRERHLGDAGESGELLVALRRHLAAAALARTCSGLVAPAMIDPIPGVEASAPIASSCSV